MGQTITFGTPEALPKRRDATDYRFPFRVIDSALIGEAEEQARTSHNFLDVGVSGTLEACWGLPPNDQRRVAFEYGRRHLAQKILDETVSDTEELLLHSSNSEIPCPLDATKLNDPEGFVFVVDEESQPLMTNVDLLPLASRIIDCRDNINALFSEKHKDKLIVAREERDLLQFFRDANSPEEFFYRVCALANAATGFNVSKLRALTGISDTSKKSISLLEAYLTRLEGDSGGLIKVLREINTLRQGYPVHGDRSDGVLGAHKFFELPYPVTDFSNAWRTLLVSYLNSLEILLEILKHETGS